MNKRVAFTIILIRGVLAVSLGVVLLFQPDKTRPILANFMGMFWLASGVISLRWGASGERARGGALLAGAIGVLAGLAMLTRNVMTAWIAQDILLSLLGVTMLLTGILHAFGGFRTGEGSYRRWSLTSFLLGLFEMVLGVMLIVEPMGRSQFFYLAAAAWALLGGLILITDALRLRRLSRQAIQDERVGQPAETQ
jgi:uncharacterized membrane protein HdeD (DUF308 family)